MKCQNCNERPATVHYTETINGVTKSMNICDACAAKLHGTTGFFPFFAEAFAPQEKSEHCCPSCGATIDFFKRYNKFSCPDCYNAFAPVTDRILKQIHKTNRHKTEMPAQPSKRHTKRLLCRLRIPFRSFIPCPTVTRSCRCWRARPVS